MDKILHALVNYAIVITLSMYGHPVVGLVLALLISFAKEALDYYDHDVFDWYDILADVIGIALALVVYCFINYSKLGF